MRLLSLCLIPLIFCFPSSPSASVSDSLGYSETPADNPNENIDEQSLSSKLSIQSKFVQNVTIATCSVEFLLGKLLRNRYLVEAKIGSGGYSNIYRVGYMGHKFAMKCQSNDETARYEILLMMQMNHPNIMKLGDQFVEYDLNFIIMELMDMDLFSYINKGYQYNFEHVFMQIMDAVIYMHDHGIYHRDLKSANILVKQIAGNRLQIKVSDFGLATRELFSNGLESGTYENMAPEIFNHHSNFPWPNNDVWSLGTILLRLITRETPWTDPNISPFVLQSIGMNFRFNVQFMNIMRLVFSHSMFRPTARQFQQMLLALNGHYFY